MKNTLPLLVVLLGLLTGDVLAQEGLLPPALEIPTGAHVRLRTEASQDVWIKGYLARADTDTISLVPEVAPPLGTNRLRLPADTVTRLEVLTGKKRQWLPGLLIGAAIGVAMGFDTQVDPLQCEVGEDAFCSRGAAVVAMTATSAAIGALISSKFEKDVWTPVALDALGSPPARGPRAGFGLRAVPGGVAARLSVGF